MAHLLMVESWVGSMSRLLPRAIREGGHEFTFLTRDLHHYLRSAPEGTAHPLLAARHVLTADTNDADSLLPVVEGLHGTLRFDGVITSCDYYLPTAARVAGRLGLPGPSAEAVENACRKDATRRALEAAGVAGPRYAVCADWAHTAGAARDIGYPLVVKPVDLCAGMYVRRVEDERELLDAYRALADFPVNARGQLRSPTVLLEELLDGPEVSVETVSFGGAAEVVGVTDKSVGGAPAFIETGHMFPAALAPEDTEAACRTALLALKGLGLDGVVAHTEIKLTTAGPRVVEVNPRPAGNRITELVRHVTGIDLAAACVDVALGQRPDLRRRDTGLRSAAIGFLIPDTAGTLVSIEGGDAMWEQPDVLEVRFAEPGEQVTAAGSNNEYLGHVMAADAAGAGARARVETLLAGVRPRVVAA
ncbi:ATP-grasp domain-containing protein [Streptomyces rapamycinicus]|uniref:Carboxylate--amine ligase n=2 Tax=Streptomyces rapamycinicus TaxID=1226757 RepID=A0A0A0NTI3_STRRN|nr:ATP-grasp domain-containing protein [Streptomyces rapamycinicus]AGP59768.1 carboxylate--amine ligase [Streptomyces rapamycinicus NRRL 5491]MBB4789076.1 biotin carboxylase [Streptomyces rapamycinicus]RLV77046.1 carboxylate--amine ligase [Streptomyces rapamycinicus NRRL 5491]UTO67453.1 ATP-grasp domain-containing protein [Streptomyces rapamycinicus]UTP35407.1 ATP-grasp domain-containing protein [Streptomyces rapamycinicus NRRL 5491]